MCGLHQPLIKSITSMTASSSSSRAASLSICRTCSNLFRSASGWLPSSRNRCASLRSSPTRSEEANARSKSASTAIGRTPTHWPRSHLSPQSVRLLQEALIFIQRHQSGRLNESMAGLPRIATVAQITSEVRIVDRPHSVLSRPLKRARSAVTRKIHGIVRAHRQAALSGLDRVAGHCCRHINSRSNTQSAGTRAKLRHSLWILLHGSIQTRHERQPVKASLALYQATLKRLCSVTSVPSLAARFPASCSTKRAGGATLRLPLPLSLSVPSKF